MMTNPSLDTTTSTAPSSRPSNADGDDLQRLGERFEQALRDADDRSPGGGEAAANQQPNADAPPRQAAHDDEGGEHDARDDATHELAAVAAASVLAPPLQAASAAQAAAASAAADPRLIASATQGAIGAGLSSGTPAQAPALAATGPSPNTWSLTLPGLQAWSMQATQPQAGGAWTLDVVAPAGPHAMHGAAAAAAAAGTGARIDATALAAQAQVLSQRLATRDVAVDRVTLRRRGIGDASDDDVVADAVPGAIDAARGHRRRE